jgi:hypothetical protein
MYNSKYFPGLKNQHPVWLLYLIFGISISLLTYSILRAIRIELTMDEICSWKDFTYPHLYPKDYNQTTSNDHWLNSWLMQITGFVFGRKNWSIRLPNLIAHAVYLFFTARIVFKFRSSVFALTAFIVLNSNPYLLDFFSAARGYGLLIAGMAATIFYFLQFVNVNQSKKNLHYFILFSTLAFLANFASIPLYITITGTMILFILSGDSAKRFSSIGLILLVCIPVLAIVIPHLLRMQKVDALYCGTTTFWEGTVKSLVTQLLYDSPYVGNDPFRSAIPTIYILTGFLLTGIVISIYRNGFSKGLKTSSTLLSLIFFGTLVVLFLQHQFMNALYPVWRIGLYLFILFLFAVIFTFNELFKDRFLSIIGVTLALPAIFHFCISANTGRLLEWKYAAGTQVAADDLERWYKNFPGKRSFSVCTQGVNGSTLHYIKERDHLTWMNDTINWSGDQPGHHDFYYVEKWAIPSYNTSGWIPMDTMPYSGNVLYIDSSLVKH